MVNGCQNNDLNELYLYFSTGKDLSSYVWENYNFFDLWNAVENGATPPERDPCNSSYIASVRSCTLAVLGNFTTINDFVGFNRDFYNLYLLIIGQEPIITPSFDSDCVARLYSVFSIGLTGKWRQPQDLTAVLSKSAALAFVQYQQPQSFDALLNKSAALDAVQFLQGQEFNVELGSAFDADYQAVLDYATLQGYSLPTSEQQALQNQLMIDLKAAATNGLSSYHVVNIWANNTGNNNFGTIQWQDQSTQSTLNNSPTYTSNEGIRGDGVAAFYDTLFAPSTGNQNDVMFGLWYMNNRVDTTEGMTNGVRFHLRPRTTGNELRTVGINSSTGVTTSTGGSITSSVGFSVAARDTSTVIELYKNGTLIGSGSDTSITPTSLTICGLCRRTGAGGTANHNDSLQAFTIIAKATEINQSDLYNALNDYISAI